jgi:hypothetical protein
LRECIARYERYLSEGVSADLAEVYRAEIAAAKTMLDEVERASPCKPDRLCTSNGTR